MKWSRRKFLGASATAVVGAGVMAKAKLSCANERIGVFNKGIDSQGSDHIEDSSMDRRFRTIYLHTHPSMVAYMLHAKFWKEHTPPSYGFSPWSMRVDMDALLAGGVKAFLCTVYVVERTMFDDVWPLRLVSKIFPRSGHMPPLRSIN
jgi:hypothetical protein